MIRDSDARLVAFSFSSRLEADQSTTALMQLARQIWRDNVRAGLTGVLTRCGTDLDQTIEGPGDVVAPLSARILTDPRHGDIAIRFFGPIARRHYAGWSVEGFEQPSPVPFEPPPRGSLLSLVARQSATHGDGGRSRTVAT